MAHGLEARVPFLSRDMLALALRIPMEWKLLGEDGQEQAQEKALLREAFAGWLPDEILWRRKEQFGDGSGTADVMSARRRAWCPTRTGNKVHPRPSRGAQPRGAGLPAHLRRAPRWHPRRAGVRPFRDRLTCHS